QRSEAIETSCANRCGSGIPCHNSLPLDLSGEMLLDLIHSYRRRQVDAALAPSAIEIGDDDIGRFGGTLRLRKCRAHTIAKQVASRRSRALLSDPVRIGERQQETTR